MGNPDMKGQANDPAVLVSQETAGHVLRVDMDVEGRQAEGTLSGYASQMEKDECCQSSCWVCGMVENQNRRSGWTSLSQQVAPLYTGG